MNELFHKAIAHVPYFKHKFFFDKLKISDVKYNVNKFIFYISECRKYVL